MYKEDPDPADLGYREELCSFKVTSAFEDEHQGPEGAGTLSWDRVCFCADHCNPPLCSNAFWLFFWAFWVGCLSVYYAPPSSAPAIVWHVGFGA